MAAETGPARPAPAMTPLRIAGGEVDIEAIHAAIRERVRARDSAMLPVDPEETRARAAARIAALEDWNFPRELWHAMWPPNLQDWNLDQDFPITSHRKTVAGALLVRAKRILRAVLRVPGRPLLSRQVEINRALGLMTLSLADELAETRLHLRAVEARIARLSSVEREGRGDEPPLLVIEDARS